MKIVPINQVGDCCEGRLNNITVAQITKILGFKPNCKDDPSKVKNSWGFLIKGDSVKKGVNGLDVRCGIWDYKGSNKFKQFSTFGPADIFRELFGDKFNG